MPSVTSTGSAFSATRPRSNLKALVTAGIPPDTFLSICETSHALALTPYPLFAKTGSGIDVTGHRLASARSARDIRPPKKVLTNFNFMLRLR